MSGFVSNFFFGQGPWTPWQMFCFGIVSFLAGILFFLPNPMIAKIERIQIKYGLLESAEG